MYGDTTPDQATLNRLAQTAESLANNHQAMVSSLSAVKSMSTTTQSYGNPMTGNYGPPQSGIPDSYYHSVPSGIFKQNTYNNQPPLSSNTQPASNNSGYNSAFAPTPPNQMNNIIKFLEQSVQNQGKLIMEFVQEIRDLQQYTRKNSLLIHGLDIPTDKEDLQGYKFANYVCDKLNGMFTPSDAMAQPAKDRCVKVQELIGPLQSRKDIDATHILPTRSKKKDKKSCIVVKFVSRLVRNELFYNKSALKGSGVSISEHLTKHQQDLQDKVRTALGYDAKVWSNQGKIFGIVKGQKHLFRTENDIKHIVKS